MSFSGADLHCHSTVSDGAEAPAALAARRGEPGLGAPGPSDHDALHGLPELEAAATGTGLITVQAAELSTRCEGEDVHLRGLFVDAGEPDLVAKLVEVRRERDQRGEAMVAKLASIGIVLDLAAIRQTVGDGAFGRPHVARALMADGYVGSFDEAFDRYLTKGKPGYVPKQKWTLEDAIRSVDAAQFQQRRQTFDFDMTRMTWAASLSPGNEQNFRWSQAAAGTEGSFNLPGAKQPAIDALIEAMLAAPTREDFVAAVRALDRVLISGYYVVPLLYLPDTWIARWNTVEHPQTTALTGPRLESWYAATP